MRRRTSRKAPSSVLTPQMRTSPDVRTDDGAFRDVRRRIGYLPESFVAYDNLTGMELLHLFADLKKVARSSCGNVLERVGLSAAADRRVGGYSKGMRQRLGFAQLLLGAPELVFLDEPTNGLDPDGIHDFYRILHQLREEGATIVITSHILAEIQERVDDLVILSGGRISAGMAAPARNCASVPCAATRCAWSMTASAFPVRRGRKFR